MNLRQLSRAAACCLALIAGAAAAQETDKDAAKPKPQAKGPAFRFLGPAIGNRAASIAGVPGDPNTWYVGAASGGVWKSVDGGASFKPIFDDQPVAAIGALAVAPSDPNVVWAGTGEAWAIRDADVAGDGVYKSVDAGKTWTHMGLDAVGRIGRVIIDPKDPNDVYVCATGRLTAPQAERGVFRTTDGGKTWTRSLFADPNTGCSGLSMDAHDPKTLFAGMWQVEMHPWAELSGGPGSGVYVTHDGGVNWTRIEGRGLPHSPVGKIDVAVAPSDSSRVYALIETDRQGAMWRSDDGGATWRVSSWDRTLIGRAGYYIRLAVSPADKDKVLVASSSFHVSTDGGATFPTEKWGGDNHDIWMDPKDASRFAITFDGGAAITTSGGKGFHPVSLPIGQMYHVAVDDQVPYFVYGNMQDDGTMRGPSIPRGGGWGAGAYANGWEYGMGGCESGHTVPDPTDPDIVWATCYGASVTRWNAKTRQARSVSPWLHTLDSAPDQVKQRCHWTPPLAIDPFDHNAVYFGCQMVLKTTNGGQSWSETSPDLSTRDPSHIVPSGGLIGDNLGQFYGEVIYALAFSKIQRGLLWAGTNDGKVWLTRDGARTWTDVSANIAGMPKWGIVTSIEPSHFQPGTAFVSVDAHLLDDRDPYIFATRDFGRTWEKISGGLPKGELGYIRNVSEDPNAQGLLFAGAGSALYWSPDTGKSWTRLKDDLPPSPVTWTVVQPRFRDLVVSTWGRGFYILDDITPLEQMAKAASDDPVRLFEPRKTWRLEGGGGALINFALKSAPKAPVRIEILDAKGAVLRSFTKPGREGLNRVAWDLRYDPLKTILLRTVPPEDPHIWEESRFKGKDIRPITHWGMPARQPGPVAAPGRYQVRLTVDGVSRTAPLELLIDPHGEGRQADLEAALKLQLRIRDDVGRISDMVNAIEQMRKTLADLQAKPGAADAETLAATQTLDGRLQAVEYAFFAKNLAASDDKTFISAVKVYYDLLWLNGEVGTGAGDVAGGANRRPTDKTYVLLADMEKQIDRGAGDYRTLLDRDVAAFNRTLAAKGLAPLSTAVPPRPADEDIPASDDDGGAD